MQIYINMYLQFVQKINCKMCQDAFMSGAFLNVGDAAGLLFSVQAC